MTKRKSLSHNTFLAKSHEKIEDLRKKMLALSKEENLLKKEELQLLAQPKSQMKEMKISLSIESVIKATVAILLLIALVQVLGMIKSVIILFIVALFLAAAVSPAVDKMEKYKIPRAFGVVILYVLIVGIFVILFSSLVPIFAEQIGQLALGIRGMIQNLITNPSSNSWFMKQLQPYALQLWQNIDQTQVISQISNTLSGVAAHLTNLAGNAIGAIFIIFNGLFNMILVLIITFFMVTNSNHTRNFFHSLFPHKYSAYISLKSEKIGLKIGEWIRGQLVLALIMGALSFAIFSMMGLNYTLTLSLLSALTQLIPYLGPVITFAAATLIAINQNPVLVLWLIPAYIFIQFLESNILSPMIMGKTSGLNPIVIIFAMLSGATIGATVGGSFGLGLVGMIIAVPTANIISLFVEDYTDKNK